jgi:hypothetical protein
MPPKTFHLGILLANSATCATASTTFATNYAGATSTVFLGILNTPPQWMADPTAAPAAFDFIIPTQAYAHPGGPMLWEIQAITVDPPTPRISLDMASSGFPLFAWGSFQMAGTGCTTANGVFEHRAGVQNQGFLGRVNFYLPCRYGPSMAPAFLFVDFVPVDVPIGGLCTSLRALPTIMFAGSTDAAGNLDINFAVPNVPQNIGVGLASQGGALDGSQQGFPIALSNGLFSVAPPMQPAFPGCFVYSTVSAAEPTGTLRTGAAVVVRFH